MKFTLKKSAPDSPAHIIGKLYDRQFPGGRFVYYTGEYATYKQWNGGKLRKGSEALRIRLNKISKAAAEYIMINRENLTPQALKTHLDALRPKAATTPKELDPKSFLQQWRDYLDAIRDTVNPQTVRNYDNSCNTFEAFLKANVWPTITPDKFTVNHYKRFEGFLKQPRKATDKEGKVKQLPAFKPNQQAKTLKHFKACIRHMGKLGVSVGFHADEIKYREKPGLKISLSEEQLQGFIDAAFTGPDDVARDLFVVQCSLGPRISDLRRIDKNVQGHKIIYQTQKTKEVVEIPIPPQVRAILEKYNYELPKLSEQRYREGIKRIYRKLYPDNTIQVREGNAFKTVPIHEEISSHDAVRTFITLSHERGMSVNSIAKLTGKTVKVLLDNYLVESQKVADKEFEKAWGASPLKVAR